MAKLNTDGTMSFESVEEFLGHYDSHISRGGFYLDVDADWPLRQEQAFTITIIGEPRRAEFQAEVVFCGGGKVGLQLGPDPANAKAVAKLVRALRGAGDAVGSGRGPLATPKLKDDGTIVYDSVADLLADYQANIGSGAMYVESPREWPKGKSFAFLITVRDQADVDMPVKASVVFADGGLVGLQPELNDDARAGLASLVEVLAEINEEEEEEEEGPAEEDGQVDGAGAADKPVSRGLVYASKDEAEFGPLELFDIRPDVKPQTTLFGLLASVVAAKKPLRLELVSNQISLAFTFKADGSLVDFTGPNSELDLLKRLVRAAFLDKAKADEWEARLTPAKTVVQLLTEAKAVNRHQLMILVGEQAVDALERIRAAGEVPFRAFQVADEWEEGLPYGAFVIGWLERALKALPAETVKALLKPMWKRALKPRADARWPVADLSLDGEGRKFIKKLEAGKTLPATVAAFDKRHRDKLFRLAIALRCLRSVDMIKPAGSDAKAKDKLTELQQEVDRAEKGNRFDQAGVHWSAHRNMYGQAMQMLQRQYGRGSPLTRLGDKAAALCSKRIQIAKLAQEYLADAHTRQQYRQEVIPEGLLEESAQLLFRKGQAAMSEENYTGAVELLEMANELAPDKIEYKELLLKVKTHLKNQGR